MRLYIPLALTLLAGACGGSTSSGDADAGVGADASPGVCDGKPCLTRITDADDWEQLADDTTTRCDFDEGLKYITPATESALLQATVYQDVKVHRFHLEFLRAVFPSLFGGLPGDEYSRLVQNRATRRYFAGSIHRVIDPNGTVIGYGFDVIVDPSDPAEQLTETEIQDLGDQLRRSFALPLGYAPTQTAAIDNARSFGDMGFPVHLPRTCPLPQCVNSAKNCLAIPTDIDVCGVFMEGRSIQVEHDRLIQLTMPAGAWELPREATTAMPMTWFQSGTYGPEQTPITLDGQGSLTVVDNGAWLSYEYTQSLKAGSDTIEIRWSLSAPSDTSTQFTVEEPWLTDNAFISGGLNGSTDYDQSLALSSCTYEGLDLWYGEGVLTGGDSFRLHIRHRVPFAGSGPLNIVAAEVTLGGNSVTVDDYFNLVYAGEHHNWNNQYWVLFDTPVSYGSGEMAYGLWIDEADFSCCPLDAVWTLDASLQPKDKLTVTSYSFQLAN